MTYPCRILSAVIDIYAVWKCLSKLLFLICCSLHPQKALTYPIGILNSSFTSWTEEERSNFTGRQASILFDPFKWTSSLSQMWVFPPLEIGNDMDNKFVYFNKHIAHVEFGKIALLIRSVRYTRTRTDLIISITTKLWRSWVWPGVTNQVRSLHSRRRSRGQRDLFPSRNAVI